VIQVSACRPAELAGAIAPLPLPPRGLRPTRGSPDWGDGAEGA
jgi:hypothetical protein